MGCLDRATPEPLTPGGRWSWTPGVRVGSPKGPPIRRRPGPGLRPPRPNSPARAARAPPLCESTRSLTSPAGSPRACEPRRRGLPARSNLRPPAACVGAREARAAGPAPRVTRPCRPASQPHTRARGRSPGRVDPTSEAARPPGRAEEVDGRSAGHCARDRQTVWFAGPVWRPGTPTCPAAPFIPCTFKTHPLRPCRRGSPASLELFVVAFGLGLYFFKHPFPPLLGPFSARAVWKRHSWRGWFLTK